MAGMPETSSALIIPPFAPTELQSLLARCIETKMAARATIDELLAHPWTAAGEPMDLALTLAKVAGRTPGSIK
jgi:hypothetical protein